MAVELQDILRQHYQDIEHLIGTYEQYKAIRAIIGCRTGAYGLRQEECPECEHTRILYNSCRNRHCPKCQTLAKEKWIDARREDLLPVPYFHIVFTLPEELNVLVMQNQRLLYNILFDSVAETLAELAIDPKHLGVQLGFTSILHTWGQNLMFHPHLHVVIPNGGLTPRGQFKVGSKKFFLPVKVLSRVFRGKFMAKLQRAFEQDLLEFRGSIIHLNSIQYFAPFRHSLYQREWVVYSKRAFSGPEAVIEYLGRYTHRIAISNNRILSLEEGNVTFKWRDYRDNKQKVMTLPVEEFARRFLLHVLPHRFIRIRHYGFLANRNRKTKLRYCQRIAGGLKSKAKFANLSTEEILKVLLGKDITLCPCCQKAKMTTISQTFWGLSPPA